MSGSVDNPFFARVWTFLARRETDAIQRTRRENLSGLSGRVLAASEPFDAAVCSMVLSSVENPDRVVRQLHSMLKPGGELRYLEHVASSGLRAHLQKAADATLWPRLLGNCHTHRHTERTIAGAGFDVAGARREPTMPAWVPLPVAEFAIGRATETA